ncbi:phage portal protein [Oceanobacillus neutriphilus]|uniref:Portal protein n=1 Tax=Oceanobacillus neutriphilus TaxID=531815 RepID=A0ABQ2P3G6_9BACI|nr:portal protein [Oceanobacillus neutriphilus]
MRFYQRIKQKVVGAYLGWQGKTYDFSNWVGRKFWGIDNSNLATNETIFSVITRLSNTLASLPLKMYQDYDVKHNQASDVLINNPNPNMHRSDFINKMEVSRNETGNGYAIIMRDIRFQPEALIPIDPSYVTPFINSDDESLWYEITGVGGTYYFHNMNMLHVKHITGASRWKGINPIEVLKNTLKYDRAVQEFSLSEMEKKDSFKIKYDANLDEEKQKRVTESFRDFYRENGGILFEEPGVEINRLERKYFASDTLKSEQITKTRVANVFNVPVSFLNESEGQSYSSNEQMMIQFVQMTLTPTTTQYEQEFNRKLLSEEDRKKGYYFKFNIMGLLRGDTAARTAFYQTMLRTGGMKPDEVRRFEDLPPVGGNADKLWVSGDLYPIDMDPKDRKTTSKGGENNEQK